MSVFMRIKANKDQLINNILIDFSKHILSVYKPMCEKSCEISILKYSLQLQMLNLSLHASVYNKSKILDLLLFNLKIYVFCS